MRIDGDLDDFNIAGDIDCLKDTNYSNLVNMGDKLWEIYGQEVIHLLSAESLD